MGSSWNVDGVFQRTDWSTVGGFVPVDFLGSWLEFLLEMRGAACCAEPTEKGLVRSPIAQIKPRS